MTLHPKQQRPSANALVLLQSGSSSLTIDPSRLTNAITLSRARQVEVSTSSTADAGPCVTLFRGSTDAPGPAHRVTVAGVVLSAPTVSVNSNVATIKAALVESNTESLPSMPSNADALRCVSELHCHKCRAAVSLASFEKVKDLPSEHWHELLDCWACHQEDYSHLQKGHYAGSVIPSRERQLLVAQNYLLVHESDLIMDQLMIEESSLVEELNALDLTDESDNLDDHDGKNVFKLIKWSPITCKTCQMPLGDALLRPTSTSETITTPQESNYIALRLYKHSLDIHLENAILHTPHVSFFVNTLLDAADSNASYKFILSVGTSNKPALLVWLLNWNLLYGTGDESVTVVPAIKIGFAECGVDNESARLLEEWEKDKQVERIQIEGPFYRGLVDTMRDSHENIIGKDAEKSLRGFKFAYLNK